MKIEFIKNHSLFIAHSDFSEKDIPKAAGFWWHPSPGDCYQSHKGKKCGACEVGLRMKWWTPDAEKALRLFKYADEETKRHLEVLKAEKEVALEASRAIEADIDIPAPDGLEYMPFQKAGIAFILKQFGDYDVSQA